MVRFHDDSEYSLWLVLSISEKHILLTEPSFTDSSDTTLCTQRSGDFREPKFECDS